MNQATLSVFEFQKRYRTEHDCEKAIVRLRWPQGFICPKCNHDDGYQLKARRSIQCSLCRHQTSITAGTIFHSTKIPLLKWFWMIYFVAQDKGGASALRLSKQLGMYYKTVWYALQKIRKAMSTRDNAVIRLSGLIEMDEAFFGGYKRKLQVLVMIEAGNKTAGNVVMKRILGHKTPSEPGIRKVIEEHVDNDSPQYFVTDRAWAHTTPRKMGHKLEMHTSTPISAAQKLPWVHLAISLAKRFLIGTYHGATHRKYIQNYLDEFCYRFNRRFKEKQLCHSLLRACTLAPPSTYAAIKL